MSRLLWSVFFSLSIITTLAQESPFSSSAFTMKVTRPSPEAASFTRYGDIPVGLFTGSMNYSIPLFQLQSGKITVPVSMDYATNGIKVDAVSGRTGMDWNLRLGGVITRNIMVKGDETAALVPPSDTDSSTWIFYNYIKNVATGNSNNQPDEFNYSFLGQSGKFYFDYNGDVKQLSPNGNKITSDGSFNYFQIVTPDGTQYYFGGADQTYNYTLYGDNDYVNTSNGGRTAWYLTKIKNTYGDSVLFNYERVNSISVPIDYFSSITQIFRGPPFGSASSAPYIRSGNCSGSIGELAWTTGLDLRACSDIPVTNDDVAITSMFVYKLTDVYFKQGRLKLYYSSRDDLPGEQKLDSIDLFSNTNNSRIKTIGLEYLYSQASATYNTPSYVTPNIGSIQAAYPYLNKRLFLEKIKFFDAAKTDYQLYKFDYEAVDDLPGRLSFSQDYFGYFNGKVNGSFMPSNTIMSNIVTLSSLGSNRGIDSAFIRKGLLKRITYPAGGFSDILYESNFLNRPFAERQTFERVGVGINFDFNSNLMYSDTFTVDNPYMLTGFVEWFAQPGPDEPQVDGAVLLSIENVTTGGCVICNLNFNPGESLVYMDKVQALTKGSVYRIKLESGSPSVSRGKFEFVQYHEFVDTNVNTPAGGVRVKAIKNYTSVNDLVTVKKFNYNYPEEEVSSGDGIIPFDDARTFVTLQRSNCTVAGYGGSLYLGAYLALSSSSSINDFPNNYAAVTYGYVRETFDSSGLGGSIVTHFLQSRETLPATLGCIQPAGVEYYSPYLIPRAPVSNTDYMNGKELKKTYYKKTSGGDKKVKESTSYYSVDPRLWNIDNFYVIRRVYNRDPYIISLKYFSDYDINKYERIRAWVHIDSTIQKDYDDNNNQLTVKTSYTYGNSSHLQPTEVVQKTSTGDVSKTVTQYADDLRQLDPANTILNNLCLQNMISMPLVKKTYLNNSLLTTAQIEYNSSLLPATLKTATKAASLELETEYTKYDLLGNPQEFKVRGQASALLTDTSTGNMIAGCSNALLDDIAFAGFETGYAGGWTGINNTYIQNSEGITGSRHYSQSGFSFSKSSLSSATKYIVSYWSRNGAYSISGTQTGYPQTLSSRIVNGNTWTLYLHQVTGLSTITITGSGAIDELRLYPVNAQMTTYAYDPLIGIRSQCDANNRITYYEYDGFGRLKTIRDQDKNVIKTLDYQYLKNYNQ
jgi:YD repeat-containing protein